MLTSCGAADTSLARIQSTGVLRVGLDPTYPPFEVTSDGELQGLDVDLARSLAAATGAEAIFSTFGYDGLYDALLTDQVDVLISALVVSPERTRDFAYSRPYYDAGQVLLVPGDSPVRAPADLAGRRVAVELGALGHVEALELARVLPELTVQAYPSAAEALQALNDGLADAALVDSIGARLFLKARTSQDRPLRMLSEPVSSEPFAVVVRIEDETLLQQINVELEHLAESGQLAALVARWIGP